MLTTLTPNTPVAALALPQVFPEIKNGKIVTADGTIRWFENDKFHRLGAPAILRPDGTQEWWINGKRHRKDGPAIIMADGTTQWWRDGVLLYSIPGTDWV